MLGTVVGQVEGSAERGQIAHVVVARIVIEMRARQHRAGRQLKRSRALTLQQHKLTEGIAPELANAWPRRSKFGRRCFELPRVAYVKAR